MKTNEIIDKFAQRTHSPRGKYAASDETYNELLNRLPENDHPVVSPEISVGKPAVGKETPVIGRRHRWSGAASVALIFGISAAIAAVVTFRAELFPSFFKTEIVAETKTNLSNENAQPQILVFDNVPLKEITASLSETYGVEIIIEDDSLAGYCITATFSTEESLDEVLDILAEVVEFSYTKDSNRVVLRRELRNS